MSDPKKPKPVAKTINDLQSIALLLPRAPDLTPQDLETVNEAVEFIKQAIVTLSAIA